MSFFSIKKVVAYIHHITQLFDNWVKKQHSINTKSIQNKSTKTKEKPNKEKISLDQSINTLASFEKKEKEDQKQTYITFSSKGTRTFWLVGVLVIFGGYIVYTTRNILFVILTGLLLSIAMESGISFLNRFMKRGRAIFFAYSVFFVFLLLGFILIILIIPPQITILTNILINKIKALQSFFQTHTITQTITTFTRLPDFFRTQILTWIEQKDTMQMIQTTLRKNINTLVGAIQGSGTRIVKVIGNIISGIIDIFFKIILIMVIAIMGSIEKEKIVGFLENIGNKNNKQYRSDRIQTLYSKIGSRFHGQFFLCLIIGITTGIGLTLISVFGVHIPHIWSLAFIAGLTEFIPYIGPITGAIPALLIATTSHGFLGFIIVLGLFIIIQQLENNLLVPRIMKKQLGISSILIFISVLLGGVLRGFLGVLLAVPCVIFLTVVFDKNFK